MSEGQIRWATKLICCDFEVLLGKENSVADTLSCASFAALSLAQGVEWLD